MSPKTVQGCRAMSTCGRAPKVMVRSRHILALTGPAAPPESAQSPPQQTPAPPGRTTATRLAVVRRQSIVSKTEAAGAGLNAPARGERALVRPWAREVFCHARRTETARADQAVRAAG